MSDYRVNITRKITGKFEGGKLILYHNHQPIGELPVQGQGMTMYDGFELDQSHVYAVGSYAFEDQYAQNCDMGWC
ncbi:DUF2553 family protein [Shimazuella alba]|jgi:hypothetical protein|uniref:DUF2553 family protein n=1 Tax=Shimazuella alba TaxID=2690964 RepID=A0A6I4VQP9_9BACL|nr:DUF2553 family protein [Shimazuella alba]MXQ53929.1 DUF2553 family protein [Shimazuella alba]